MWLIWILLILLLVVVLLRNRPAPGRRGRPFLRGSGHLYQRHYLSRRNFLKLGGAVAGATVLAYSGLDETIDRWHTDKIRSPVSDRMAGFLHFFGERPWFIYWGLLAAADSFWHSSLLTRWGRQSFEAMLVGLPSLWVAQRGLGAARPSDDSHGPRFRPLADDNSASGHTFIAAIPCLVAARMANRRLPRTLAYSLSPLTGWSRINDRKHYVSQVALGYGLAWGAVDTVTASTQRGRHRRDDASAPDISSGGVAT